MLVKDLVALLLKQDQNSLAHINGIAISGILAETGRFSDERRDATGNVLFRKTPSKQDYHSSKSGLTFTHFTEMVDGIHPTAIWTA
jgi:hypothetical protein